MSGLAGRIQIIRDRLMEAAGGRDVFLLPVTKTHPPEVILPLWDMGIRDIGENRVQEYLEKKEALGDKFHFHMIGQLQTNKVRGIIEHVHLIHSVDRLRLAQEIQRQAERVNRTVDILLQVNIGEEAQKAGVPPEKMQQLVDAVCVFPNIRLRGLMTIAPLYDDPEMTRPVFSRARQLFEGIRVLPDVDILSMGMSGDAVVAVQEGSTMVRIGSAIFGAR